MPRKQQRDQGAPQRKRAPLGVDANLNAVEHGEGSSGSAVTVRPFSVTFHSTWGLQTYYTLTLTK